MIGFDRPIKPEWIYKAIKISEPGKYLKTIFEQFNYIVSELTGNEGKRKVRNVITRLFIIDESNKMKIAKNLVLKQLVDEKNIEFLKPLFLIMIIGKTQVLYKLSDLIIRLFKPNDVLNLELLKKKIQDEYGERDISKRAVSSFLKTLEYFDFIFKVDNSYILKDRINITEDQFCEMLKIFSKEILKTPQIDLNLPNALFGYFCDFDLVTIAKKYNGIYWDYHSLLKDSYLLFY